MLLPISIAASSMFVTHTETLHLMCVIREGANNTRVPDYNYGLHLMQVTREGGNLAGVKDSCFLLVCVSRFECAQAILEHFQGCSVAEVPRAVFEHLMYFHVVPCSLCQFSQKHVCIFNAAFLCQFPEGFPHTCARAM